MVKIHPHPQLPPPLPALLRRRTVSPFCLLCQLCLCLFIASFTLLLIFVFVIGGSGYEIEIYVTDASITNFNLETVTNDTFWIAYDMSFNITLTNPNTRISVYYDLVQAYAYYADHLFAEVTLPPFYQGHNTSNILRAVFEGNETLSFDSDGVLLTRFGEEKRTGVYSIRVMLSLSVRTKLCSFKYRQNPPYIYCYLRVPLISMKGKSLDSTFQATQCDIAHIIT